MVAVFVVALGVRLLHVWQIRRAPFFEVLMGDARGYDSWARRIAAGDWIGRDVFYQAPLYPYFLGVVYTAAGRSLLLVRLLQALVGALSCVLLAMAGRRFFSPRAGIVAGGGLALYAPAIFFDGLVQKSVLDLFFITLTLALAGAVIDDPSRRWRWLALGGALGAFSLTRENALVFVIVFAAWAIAGPGSNPPPGGAAFRRPAIENTVNLLLALAIVLLPVAIRNYAVGGGFYLTTSQFGPNLYQGNHPHADGSYAPLRFGRGAPEYEQRDAKELAEHALRRPLTPSDVSSFWTDRALDYITTHPFEWLKLEWRKLLLLVNATETLDTESQESYAEWSWPLRALGWFGHFGVLVPLAVLGVVLTWPNRRRLTILYAMTVTYAASVLLFYVFARYRLPLVPLLILFAAATGERRDRRERRALGGFESRSSAVSTAAVLIAAAIASNWPMLSKPLMRAITETNLGAALQDDGYIEDAIGHYRRAVEIQPDYAPAFNNLGVALRASGSIDAAIDAYQRALSIAGDYPDAHYNLANALLEKHRPVEAAAHFDIALRSVPDSAGIRTNLGVALLEAGKPQEAIAAFRAAAAAEPQSAAAHRNLGDALVAAGQPAEGIAELRRATTIDPADAAAHYDLGSALLEQQDLDGAILELRAALRLSPTAAAHNNLGIALGSQGQLEPAIEEFRRALAIAPSFADARRNLELATNARGRQR
jgi:tetratricopeptide (TPR) repeat protein/4-amino-4-deoxy-L-arabinose transferase-like glycosyltransferase